MAITPVPALSDIPSFPSLADRAAGTYNSKAYAFGTFMADIFNGQLAAVASNVYNNANEAYANAVLALADRMQTEQDRVQTGLDRVATAADRVQTNLDKLAAQAAAQQIGTAAAFTDTNPIAKDNTDPTKQVRLELAGVTTATTRVMTVPNKNGTIAMLDDIPVPSGCILLATMTPTAAATLDFLSVFSASYERYLIVLSDLATADWSPVNMRVMTGASTLATSGYYGASGTDANITAQTPTIVASGGVNGETVRFSATIAMHRGVINYFDTDSFVYLANPGVRAFRGYACFAGTVTGFRLYPQNGNFLAQGKVRVYGFTNT